MNQESLLKELNELKKRIEKLEGTQRCSPNPKEIELEIELPEAEIGGLRFNKQTVKSIFELEDDIYYSRDILFLSARNTDDDTDGDLLSEYLASDEVTQAFIWAADEAGLEFINSMSVYLPEAKCGDGIKKYNGVSWWYWLKPSASSSNFCIVYYAGSSINNNATSVGGVAPAFCVVRH